MNMRVIVLYKNGVEKNYDIPTTKIITQKELNEELDEVISLIKYSYTNGLNYYISFGNLIINVGETCAIDFKLVEFYLLSDKKGGIMRDKDGYVEKVETPEEFLDKFTNSSWEYDYISEEEIELLEGWIREYIKLKGGIK